MEELCDFTEKVLKLKIYHELSFTSKKNIGGSNEEYRIATRAYIASLKTLCKVNLGVNKLIKKFKCAKIPFCNIDGGTVY